MRALSVVPNGDPLKEGRPCFGSRREGGSVNQFSLQRGKETLRRGVVIAVALAAQAADGFCLLQGLLIVPTGVLAAAGGHPKPPQGSGGHLLFAHDPHQTMATDTDALFEEFFVQARTAIGSLALMILLTNRPQELLLLQRALARLAFLPIRVTPARDLPDPT